MEIESGLVTTISESLFSVSEFDVPVAMGLAILQLETPNAVINITSMAFREKILKALNSLNFTNPNSIWCNCDKAMTLFRQMSLQNLVQIMLNSITILVVKSK